MLKKFLKGLLSRRQWILLVEISGRIRKVRRYGFTFPLAREGSEPRAFPFPVSPENPLEELGKKYQPTKRLQNYLPFYWMHFRDIRMQVRSVLEIGVETDRSIRMWEEFFPNAVIHGFDINPKCKAFEGGRRRIHIGDQGDERLLRSVAAEAGGFDIIIDDGSHFVEHQLRTFDLLFPALSDHGIYVVEDMGGCAWDLAGRTADSLKPLVDSVMHWPRGADPDRNLEVPRFPAGTPWAHRNIIGIAFYRWLTFIMRGRNPGDNPHLIDPAAPGMRGEAGA
jgi:hypothetical protein